MYSHWCTCSLAGAGFEAIFNKLAARDLKLEAGQSSDISSLLGMVGWLVEYRQHFNSRFIRVVSIAAFKS